MPITINDPVTIDGTRYETKKGIREDTSSRGVDLAGALIVATYADGTIENLTWAALDPYTTGGATGPNIDMFFGFSEHVLITTKLLTSLEINLAPASSVFDITTTMEDDLDGINTPTSKNGFPFVLLSNDAGETGNVSVTYSNIVNLAGHPAEGDLFTTMHVDFYGLSTGGVLGSLTWNSDIDTLQTTGDLVPTTLATGTPDDDFLQSGPGDDLIDGMGGVDTLVLNGDQSHYTLTLSADNITLTDRMAGGSGTDTLVSIENLQFSDGSFDLSIRSGVVGLSAEGIAAIVELYIAYFDRAPAASGLGYWATRLADGMTLPEIANSFFVQPETQRTYEAFLNEDGSLNNTEAFVSAVFNNVLGRDPYGPYWVNELDNNPAITPAIFILAVLNGAKAPTGGAADRAYLENKTDIGVYFSAIRGLSDRDDTVTVMEVFDGSTASVDAAVAAIDQIYADALDPDNGEFLMPLVGVIDDPFAIT